MSRTRLLLLLAVAILLLPLCAGGVWWYLFGAPSVAAAELVPADTMAFATIPNAAEIAMGYQTSRLKTLVDDPNAKPIIDSITSLIGQKNLDLIAAFAPNLSGQSFIALTHFDPDHPTQIGLIAGMKPKAGLGDFNAFVEKLKATYPDLVKQGKTGTGTIAGLDYQWIQGPGAPDKVCVAQSHGWIVTAWGEASLQDWVERFQKKSATPSLAQNADYQKSLARVGKDPMTLFYLNYHGLLDILQKQMVKTNQDIEKINEKINQDLAKANPGMPAPAMPKPVQTDYLFKKLASIGGAAVGTRFENGEIVDRFSMLIPLQTQLDQGMGGATPCPFETLKFTGPDTRFYWASSINLQQYWKNLQEQAAQNPIMQSMMTSLQTWAKGAGLDVQHNIIDPLGSEFSVQMEWNADTLYPETGLFVKLAKPDDFKPTITAIVEAVRKAYQASAEIKELHTDKGPTFAALKFFQTSPLSPTITEDGPYLGVFLSENQAVRSFDRDETLGLPHNADFTRQIGDKRNGASQILFLDSPQLLDRAYRTAMPYLSLASMFNQQLGTMLKGKTLPPDLTWLAPMGAWSCVTSSDNDGIQGYSVSGVGNQGIFLGASLGGAAGAAQVMGLLPKPQPASGVAPPVPPQFMAIPPSQAAPSGDTNAPASTSPAMPDATTNTAPASSPESAPATNSSPAPASPVPDATTNAVPATNSDATPPTPEPAKTQ